MRRCKFDLKGQTIDMESGNGQGKNSVDVESESGQGKHIIKNYFSSLLDMRSNMLSYDELHEMMEENTVIHGANMWILMLAILIASIGLNVNSTAVIIGAMLISPLMSGILTMGYSLGIRDLSMLRHAAARFATQVAISLITSTVYFTLSPLTTATSEMIARTSPTLWDVLIALFGGIAGAIGNTRQKSSNVIPGVAIATALMPPLCTVGYGIATKQATFIFGALYLFVINTLFIALSALLVTRMLRVPYRQELDLKKQKRINRIITTLIVVTVVPSVLFGAYTVYTSILERNINNYLNSEFVFADTQLVGSRVDNIERTISVSLVGVELSDSRVSELEDKLADYSLEDYTLRVMQNRQIEDEDSDKITIALRDNTIRELQEQLEKANEENKSLSEKLEGQVDGASIAEKAAAIFTNLTDVKCGLMAGENGNYVLLLARVSEPLTGAERETITNFVKTESGISSVELLIDEPETAPVTEPEDEPVTDPEGDPPPAQEQG